ncbi:hypothetical protein SAMN05878443_1950 [Carnobacterium alterfunditum]|uniref:Uncharacterized protein n=1 Tax=Carnobacterium alterfunditum TaxID=28230 RepID=A0A1N6HM71_9LACT|nr:hypothetical protein [Carnobacterium alterfunditum]SIO20862.1 hypothetical protein SAMN05878443_1950 [Carnobacterium alterfunditum]
MIEIHNVPLIKGTPYSDLEKGLLAYKKNQLFQIAENQHTPIRKSAKKAEIVDQLKPVIIEKATHFFAQLDPKAAQVLSDLASGVLLETSAETLAVVQSSIESGYLFAFQVNDEVTLVIPNELLSAINKNKKLENPALFLRQLENARKIYGTYDLKQLVSVWNKYFPQSLTMEEATALIGMRR